MWIRKTARSELADINNTMQILLTITLVLHKRKHSRSAVSEFVVVSPYSH